MIQVREYDYATGHTTDVGAPYKKCEIQRAQGEIAMLNAQDTDAGYFYLSDTTHRTKHDFPVQEMLASH